MARLREPAVQRREPRGLEGRQERAVRRQGLGRSSSHGPFAAWESLVSGGVYAAHVVRGKNMNQMFNDSIPVSSGPWKFQSWQKGVQITLVKNPRFRVGPPMRLDRVVFRYILDTNARFQALEAGEGHVMEPQPQLQIAEVPERRRLRVQRWPKMRLRAHRHPARAPRPSGAPAAVREAGADHGDRTASRSRGALFRTIAPGLPGASRASSTRPSRRATEQNFRKWRFQRDEGDRPAAQRRLHRRAGGAD